MISKEAKCSLCGKMILKIGNRKYCGSQSKVGSCSYIVALKRSAIWNKLNRDKVRPIVRRAVRKYREKPVNREKCNKMEGERYYN